MSWKVEYLPEAEKDLKGLDGNKKSPHKPQLHFGSYRGAVCGSCGHGDKEARQRTMLDLHSTPAGNTIHSHSF